VATPLDRTVRSSDLSGGGVPPPSGGRHRNHFVLELPSDTRLIDPAVEFLVGRARAFDFAGSRLNLNLRVGASEAIANAILYGNRCDPLKRVRVEVELTSHRIELVVYDEGSGFDPATVPDPRLPENIEAPGGRGVFLLRELMDEVLYNEPGNCVRLVLHRERSNGPGEPGH
jgi:serine/threonine-protein kinase RsbW